MKQSETNRKTKKKRLALLKGRERPSRMSLTIVLAAFVFIILLLAIGVTALGIYAFTKFGVLVNVEGDLDLASVILFMSLSSLIIGGLIAFFSSRLPLKPINNLINKMNRLAAGDFKARLRFGNTLSAHPAFCEISTSFNKMAEELENTELLRRDFINDFSHEFKTPIASIRGFARLLAKENLTDAQRAAYLRAIEEESTRLSAMATNVLSLSKIENQTILSEISCFNLSEQLRGAILVLEGKWAQKDISLSIDFEEYEIEACEELLREVWINLLDNAVKFSPEGGEVFLSIRENAESLAVTICNTGSEIPPEKQDKIFHRFYQADESHATAGNGVGLAIVKRIVDLHGGNVSVQSGDGRTAFTVSLPKNQQPPRIRG